MIVKKQIRGRVLIKILHVLFFSILCAPLLGCQFHLRGVTEKLPLPYRKIHVVALNTPPHLTSIVKQRLLRDGATLTRNAPYRLTLHQEVIKKNILSISSGSSSRQYQVVYQMYFSFEKTKGLTLIENAPILVTRFLTINNDRILGSHDEEEHIMDDMRYDAALQMVERIRKSLLTKRNLSS